MVGSNGAAADSLLTLEGLIMRQFGEKSRPPSGGLMVHLNPAADGGPNGHCRSPGEADQAAAATPAPTASKSPSERPTEWHE